MEKLMSMMATSKAKTYIYIAVAVVILTIGALLIYKFTNIKSDVDKAIDEKKMNEQIDAEISVSAVSLSSTEIAACVDKLYQAMEGWGTDEDAIYEVFGKVTSRSDVLAIKKKFSIKDGMTLDGYIASELNASERKHLNQILENNNVNYSF